MASRHDLSVKGWSYRMEPSETDPPATPTVEPAAPPLGPCRVNGRDAKAPDGNPNENNTPAPDYVDWFEHAPVGYMILDQAGCIVRINQTGAAMLGWDAACLRGKPFARWVMSHDKQWFHSHYTGVRDNHGCTSRRLRVKNRRGRTAHLRLESRRDNESAAGAAFCRTAMIDVSNEQEAARRQRYLESKFNHVARVNTAGELASNLAHELNQPLGTIVLNCEAALRLLKSGAGRVSELSEALTHTAEAATFASRIIRNLRGFLRNDNDTSSVCEIASLIRDVSRLIEADARDTDIVLETEIDSHLPAIRVNGVQIEQVLMNLAHNSIEAMRGHDGGSHRVVIRACQEVPSEIRVSVADTGPGIGAKERALMFTPLYTTKRDGMGMGLSISRTIVEAHGGCLWAAPESEGGATVYFTLPTMVPEHHAH